MLIDVSYQEMANRIAAAVGTQPEPEKIVIRELVIPCLGHHALPPLPEFLPTGSRFEIEKDGAVVDIVDCSLSTLKRARDRRLALLITTKKNHQQLYLVIPSAYVEKEVHDA